MIKRIVPFVLAIPCFFPAFWRISASGLAEPVGLFSDLGLGCVLFASAWLAPRWLRTMLLLIWALFQAMAMELLAAVGRMPIWQDVHYLVEPSFLENSASGFNLAEPIFIFLLLFSTAVAMVISSQRPKLWKIVATTTAGFFLLLYANYSALHSNQSLTAKYNPLHWFVADALFQQQKRAGTLQVTDLPVGLRTLDLDGKNLLNGPKAKNVLIIVMEGISGIYNPEIRKKMGVADGPFEMTNLADVTQQAMLIPDFVLHSHQTIRGLYAIHCGDLSKLSFETPKGIELQVNPQRGQECLPAQMAANGWDTHFLQGAPLQFMNKDRVMPAMGFQNVHGLEWFTKSRKDEFVWGTSDKDFFSGARSYVQELQKKDTPWLLSLLTVATHQPFDAPAEFIEKYGSRKIASVARLDEAVANFIRGLKEDGVLNETLVIFTSDESHGHKGTDWFGAWGLGVFLAPGQETLPRLKEGTFGLMDIEASILDYFSIPIPPSIIGRSVFRQYETGREMVSYTSSKLRWQTEAGILYECSVDGNCFVSESAKILQPERDRAHKDTSMSGSRLFGLATVLDQKLTAGLDLQKLQFGHGEIRPLPEKIRNQWTDNLVGAQYLDFPKDSNVEVDIHIKAVATTDPGVQLKLVLRQFEREVGDIDFPPFPLLQPGEESHIQFAFSNPKARKAFSFHLVGEGKNSSIQLQKFEVAIRHGG